MHAKWTKTVAILLILPLLLLTFPSASHAGDFSDNSSEGAAITIGLFAAVLAVLFLVSFKTDMDNIFSKNQTQEPRKQDDSLTQNVSLVLDLPRRSSMSPDVERDSEFALARGLNVGVRVQF